MFAASCSDFWKAQSGVITMCNLKLTQLSSMNIHTRLYQLHECIKKKFHLMAACWPVFEWHLMTIKWVYTSLCFLLRVCQNGIKCWLRISATKPHNILLAKLMWSALILLGWMELKALDSKMPKVPCRDVQKPVQRLHLVSDILPAAEWILLG